MDIGEQERVIVVEPLPVGIPVPCFLHDPAPVLDNLDLTSDLGIDCPLHAPEGVHVLDLGACT